MSPLWRSTGPCAAACPRPWWSAARPSPSRDICRRRGGLCRGHRRRGARGCVRKDGAQHERQSGVARNLRDLARRARGLAQGHGIRRPPGPGRSGTPRGGLAGEIAMAPTLRDAKISRERIRMLKRLQAAHRDGFGILVQPEVAPPTDGSFAGLGFSFSIDATGVARPFAINGQLYRDASHKHFLGAYMGPEVDSLVAQTLLTKHGACAPARCSRLSRADQLRRAARPGGPDHLHSRLQSAPDRVFPTLAVGGALGRQGFTPRRLLTLGYRGEPSRPTSITRWRPLPTEAPCSQLAVPAAQSCCRIWRAITATTFISWMWSRQEAARWIAPGGAIGATNPGPAAPARFFL